MYVIYCILNITTANYNTYTKTSWNRISFSLIKYPAYRNTTAMGIKNEKLVIPNAKLSRIMDPKILLKATELEIELEIDNYSVYRKGCFILSLKCATKKSSFPKIIIVVKLLKDSIAIYILLYQLTILFLLVLVNYLHSTFIISFVAVTSCQKHFSSEKVRHCHKWNLYETEQC